MMIFKLHALRSQHLLLTGWMTLIFLAMVFAQEAQSSLAHTLYKIKARKARFSRLTNGPSVT